MISFARKSEKSDLDNFAPEVRRGLDQLAQAYDYAQDLDCPLWEFAVEIERLVALGMTTGDLRWLIKRGYLSHACETTAGNDQGRQFKVSEQNLAFSTNTCFVLTDAGLAMLGRDQTCQEPGSPDCRIFQIGMPSRGATADGQCLSYRQAAPRGNRAESPQGVPCAVPNWDKSERTFLVGESLIKRYRVPSPNQEAVLEAFQEEGWPKSIDDPLPPLPDHHSKRRLRDTIKCLNMNQATRLIRFRGDGTGERVRWELLPDLSKLGPILPVDSTERQPLRRAA